MDYTPEFLDSRKIFSSSEEDFLRSLVAQYPYETFLDNHRSFEERSIDYAYVSSKIEGNQYSRKGASMLLQYGFTEAGKTYQDATMLVNLRDAFVNVTLSPNESIEKVLSKHFVCSIHSQVASKLLETNDRGQVRNCAVTISGTDYVPLKSSFALEQELSRLLATAREIENPFEQAVYTHCNLAYLQYFQDGNKRVSRLMQTAVMATHGLTPIFLQESSVHDYLASVVHYYETGDFSAYAELFLREYEHTILQLQGKTKEQLEAEERALESIARHGR